MKKRLLVGFLMISFSVAAQTQSNTAVYQIPSKKGGTIAKLQFIEITPNKAFVKLNYTGPAPAHNLGVIADTVSVKQQTAFYKTKEDPSCLISFQIQPNGINVIQDSKAGSFECGFGRNVHIDGFYEKTKIPALVPIKTGLHNFSLQWIGMQIPGKVTITEAGNNMYKIVGEQKGLDNTDFLRISGNIYAISERELIFIGIINSKVSFLNKGAVCTREGVYTFKAAANKKYWRLQQQSNCEGGMTVDYIDIFFY